MRIISGDLKGRRLKSVGKLKIRPPLDKVKQAIFDILKNDIVDKEVLDLFSGSGSLGIEALSRGVKSVTFVESSFKNQKLLKENLVTIWFLFILEHRRKYENCHLSGDF